MGFRTLAIQQRSSEVWQVLAAVKTEWRKYEDVLKKVQKKLQEATNTVDSASQRTRAIGRKLVTVEDMPNTGIAESLLGLDTPDPGHDDDTDSSDSN
jgi:DNA recombination protein RmuC